MTLYFYSDIEQPAVTSQSRSVSVAQGYVAAVTKAQTANYGTTSPDIAIYGQQTGRLLSLFENSLAFIVPPVVSLFVQSQPLPTSSGQAGSVQLGSSRSLLAAMPSMAVEQNTTPGHLFLPAKTASKYLLRRTTGRLINVRTGDPWDSRFSLAFGPPGQVLAAVPHKIAAGAGRSFAAASPEGLTVSFGYFRSLLTADSAVIAFVRGVGKVIAVAAASLALSNRTQGRFEVALTPALTALIRTLPVRARTASPQTTPSPAITKMLSRAFVIAATTAIGIGRGLLKGLPGFQSQTAARAIALSRSVAAATAAASHIIRTPARYLTTGSADVAVIVHGFNLLRGLIAATVLLSSRSSSKGLATTTPAVTPVPGILVIRNIPKLVTAATTQSAGLMRIASHFLVRGAANAAAMAVSRICTFNISLTAGMANTGSLRRVIAWIIAVASPSQMARPPLGLGVTKGVATGSTQIIGASRGRPLPATDGQTSHGVEQKGFWLTAADGQTVAQTLVTGRVMATLAANVAAVARGSARLFATVAGTDGALTALAIGRFRLFTIMSGTSLHEVGSRGRPIPAISACLTGLGLATSKTLGALSTQASAIGRLNAILLAAVSGSVVAAAAAFNRVAAAAQAMVSGFVRFYYPFPLPWAYQEVLLQPLAGGPAEPPSLGPLDPADQLMVGFDWSKRAQPGDPLVSAWIVSVPLGLEFTSPVAVNGTLVQVAVAPLTSQQAPASYSLRCTAAFGSGRVSSFTVPLPIRSL